MALGAVVVAAVGFGLWTFVLKGALRKGGAARYLALAPDRASVLVYVDVAALRRSELYERFRPLIGEIEKRLASQDMPVVASVEGTRQAFTAGARFDALATVVRSERDEPLSDVMRRLGQATAKSHEGQRYVEVVRGAKRLFVAKTAPHTYCYSDDESALKAACDGLREGRTPKLDEAFQPVVARVKGHDLFFALSGVAGLAEAARKQGMPLPREAQMLPMMLASMRVKGAGMGVSLGSWLSAEAVVSFGAAEPAEELEEAAQKGVASALEEARRAADRASGDGRELAQAGVDVLRSVRVRRSGALVTLRARVSVRTLIRLIDQFEQESGKTLSDMLRQAPLPVPMPRPPFPMPRRPR